MNWMSKLLHKPAAKPSPPAAPSPAAKPLPVIDCGALRQALAAAVDAEQVQQAARELGLALAAMQQAPLAEDPQATWLAAASQVADKALALAWMGSLADETCLGELAIQGRFAETRLAAVQRISDESVLERVAKASRDKDKRVYRSCAERLRQGQQAVADARRAALLLEGLQQLLAVIPLHLSHLLELEKGVLSLGEQTPLLADCRSLLEQAHIRLQQESLEQRELLARAAAAQALLAECTAGETLEPGQLEAWRAGADSLRQAQPELPAWLTTHAAAAKIEKLLQAIDSRLLQLTAEAESAQARAAAVAHQAELAVAAPIVAEPIAPPIVQAPSAPPPPKIDQVTVRQLLLALEAQLEQGQLAAAEAAELALSAALGSASLHGELESRQRQAQAQLGKLRSWAQWSTEQAREELIAAAEQLLTGEPSVDELAQVVPALREKWKQLNAHGATAKGQWERFDGPLKKAYAPVVLRQAEVAAQQAVARQFKEALCLEWEAATSSIVWESADYKAVDAQRQEILRRWRAAESAGFRNERALSKRFDKLLKSLEQGLGAMRERELARRQQLIAEAEALRELSDLGRAMTLAKALQGRWMEVAVPLGQKRSEEQKLWARFRAACNDVFVRRDAARAQQREQHQLQTKAMQGLLDDFAASLLEGDANAIKQSLTRFAADWKAARAKDRELADKLEPRARDLQSQAQLRSETLLQEKHNASFDLLAQKAALAAAVEAAALALESTEAQLALAKQTWDGLPRLAGKAEALLAQRLARAATVTAPDLARGHEARESLLLDLEMALGLPSPESYADARRRRQLQRLQSRFGAAPERSLTAEDLLLQWYATAAAADAALEERLALAKQALLQQTARKQR